MEDGVPAHASQAPASDLGVGAGEPNEAPVLDPAPPSQGMAARNARVRKPPEKYTPAMRGKKYAVAMTQIAESQGIKAWTSNGSDVCETHVQRRT